MSFFDSVLDFFGGFDFGDALMAVSTASTVLGAGAQAYGAYKQADAAKEATAANAQGYEQNRRYAEAQANDATARGAEEARRARLATRMLIGSQRARMAANNVRVDSGTPLAIQQDTRMLGEMDVGIILENARREADGYRNQGENYGIQAALTRRAGEDISPFLAVAPTVLTTAGSVADKWLRFREDYDSAYRPHR
jgi:hypothetical protein